jgi:hypothetical protein
VLGKVFREGDCSSTRICWNKEVLALERALRISP